MDENEIIPGPAAIQPQVGGQSIFYHRPPSLTSWLSASVFMIAGFVELYVMNHTSVAMEPDPACMAKAAANLSNPFAAGGALCPLHPIGSFGATTAPIIATILISGGALWISFLFYKTILKGRKPN